MHKARLAFHGLALAGELVERHAVFLDRADHGRGLVEIAMKFGEGGFDLILGKIRHGLGFQNLAVGVLAVGRLAEAEGADILLVLAHEEVLDFCAPAEGED